MPISLPFEIPKVTLSQGLAAAFGIGWAATAFNTYADLRFDGPFGIGIGFEGWKPKAERMEVERDAVRTAYQEAQAVAAEKARNARLAKEAEYTRKMEQANAELESLRAEWRDATARYIAADRLRHQAARSASGGTGTSSQGGDTGSDLGPDPVPVMADPSTVQVSEADLYICANNTARLIVVQEWAEAVSE